MAEHAPPSRRKGRREGEGVGGSSCPAAKALRAAAKSPGRLWPAAAMCAYSKWRFLAVARRCGQESSRMAGRRRFGLRAERETETETETETERE